MNVPGIKQSFRGWRASASRLLWSPDLESSCVISLAWFIKSPRELKLGSTPIPCNESDAQVPALLGLYLRCIHKADSGSQGETRKPGFAFHLPSLCMLYSSTARIQQHSLLLLCFLSSEGSLESPCEVGPIWSHLTDGKFEV